MCGIAGIVDIGRRPVEPWLVRRLCRVLRHRGPDDEGYHFDRHVGLGQQRLAILDVIGGRQPMSNEDGTVWVVFNGEIYNFHELRQQLEGLGHQFATRSDTEVIVHAYEQYGPQSVRQLRGMFAFALWDQRAEMLVLARDRFGKKPLFYGQMDHHWVFGSELQALAQHPGFLREVDWTAVDEYLTYGYIPAPKTIFRGVYKLPPAHYLTLRLTSTGPATNEMRVERYWRLVYRPKLKIGEEEAAEGLLDVLTEAVRLRMVADVPVGGLLSGGIDSSVIVALMSRLSDQAVKTFSIGFDEQQFDELGYARLLAERYATEHHEFVVRPNALEVLPMLVRHYGEPYADASAVPTYYLARLAADHVKVALNGDGGDECFAGYERYLGGVMAERYQKLPALARRFAIEPLSRLLPAPGPPRSRLRQARRFLDVAGRPAPERYLRWIGYFSTEKKGDLYTPELRQHLHGYDGQVWMFGLWEQVANEGHDRLDTMLAVDVESYLPYDLLVKMDIATMANSLEARSPFLDHKVMEFCASLPSGYKIRGMRLKYLLKRACGRLLPAATARRPKMGFGLPVGYWMRGDLRSWVEDMLLSPRALKRGYFRPEVLRHFLVEHLDGRQAHSLEIWALLWLEMWHREFLD